MATRCFVRSLPTTKQSLTSLFHHSYTTASAAAIPNSSFLFRVRALVTAASTSYFRRLVPAISTRAFSSRQTTTSLNDPNPNWSNRPPKETILLDGCDFEHWLVVMDPPEGDVTRDDIIDSYIKTLATVVGRFDLFLPSNFCYLPSVQVCFLLIFVQSGGKLGFFFPLIICVFEFIR